MGFATPTGNADSSGRDAPHSVACNINCGTCTTGTSHTSVLVFWRLRVHSLHPGYWKDRQSVKSWSARTVAGSEPRPAAKCQFSLNSPLQLTHFARPAALLTEQTWRVFVKTTSLAQKHPLGVVGLLLASPHLPEALGFRRRRLVSQPLHPILRNTLRSVIVFVFF